MSKYKNEADFRTKLCKELNKVKVFTQKLESEGMNSGIPDMIACRNHRVQPIELKYIKCDHTKFKDIKVDWRPGQQAWAFNFHSEMLYPVITIVAFEDGYAVIEMLRPFKSNIVSTNDYLFYRSMKGLIACLDFLCTWRIGENVHGPE